MKARLLNNEKGIAFILEVIAICVVLTAVGVVGYRYFQQRGISLLSGPQKDLTRAHNVFGFNVVKALSHGKNDNVFISPTSIALALSMVYNGASGETKQAMTKTLQLPNMDISRINQQSLGLINLLQNPDKDVELDIANSVWTKKGVAVEPVFLKTVEDYYKAKSSVLDFKYPGAPDEINNWVNKNTKGKIPSIVDSISPDMIVYLINATYFKGTWTKSFDKTATSDGAFTPSQGASYDVPFMEQSDNYSYLKTDGFQSVSLPYGKDKRLSMCVFLPDDLGKFVESLDASTWDRWISQYKPADGTLMLPRFKLEYDQQLKDVLTQLGMGMAFGYQADFSGIGKAMFISEVKHKTYLDVSEEGTEAAAATSVELSIQSAAGGPTGFSMIVDRPFFVAIRDNKTGEILFTGVVNHP